MKNNELKQLIIDNPNLPIKVMVSADNADFYDYYTIALKPKDFGVEELTLFNDVWLDRDDMEDKARDILADDLNYANLSDEDFDKEVEKYIENNCDFQKHIVIYVQA